MHLKKFTTAVAITVLGLSTAACGSASGSASAGVDCLG